MKRVNPVTKGKSVKTESVKKTVEKAAAVVAEEFKQEKLAETVSVEPTEENNEEKKTAEKKAGAVKEEIFLQFGNQEVFAADVVERVKSAYIAEGHATESIEKVRVYIKPEENMIYYVVNDDYASGISLF